MIKAERLRVERLTRADFKAVLNELLIFCVYGPFPNLGPSISLVIEKRVAYMAHMDPDLVGPASLEAAFDDCNESEPLDDFIVGDCDFSLFRVVINAEPEPVVRVPADSCRYRSFILLDVAPDHCYVQPVD